MSDSKVYPVPASVASAAHIDEAKYEAMYQKSINNPEGFWAEQADEFVTWYKKWDTVVIKNYIKKFVNWQMF